MKKLFKNVRIDCGEDGIVDWEGHLSCGNCHAVFHVTTAPVFCGCGKQLRPDVESALAFLVELTHDDKKPRPRRRYSGRPCCPTCARKAMA